VTELERDFTFSLTKYPSLIFIFLVVIWGGGLRIRLPIWCLWGEGGGVVVNLMCLGEGGGVVVDLVLLGKGTFQSDSG